MDLQALLETTLQQIEAMDDMEAVNVLVKKGNEYVFSSIVIVVE